MNKKEEILYKKQYGNKALKEYYKKQRVTNNMNTGTRDMKSNKDYNRAANKRITDKDY